MIDGVHGVHAQNAGVAPETLQQLLAGQQANQELQGMQNQIAAAEQLRGAPLPEMRGSGSLITAANPLEFLASAIQRRQGQGQLSEMQAQADALRGNVAEGQQAQVMADLQQKGESQRLNQMTVDKQLEASRLNKESALQWQKDKKIIEGKQLRGPYKPYMNEETGEIGNFANTLDGTVDEDMNPASIEGWVPMSKSTVAKKLGFNSTSDPKLMREVIAADTMINQHNQIVEIADSFDDADLSAIQQASLTGDKALNDVLVGAITPSNFEAYAQNNLRGYTPKVKRFLQKINSLSAVERNRLFGSALTEAEIKSSQGFMPNAVGLTFTDMMRRLEGMAETPVTSVNSIDNISGSRYTDRLTKPVFYKGLAGERPAPTAQAPQELVDIQTRRAAIAARRQELQQAEALKAGVP